MKLVRHCVQCLLAAAPVEPALRYHDEFLVLKLALICPAVDPRDSVLVVVSLACDFAMGFDHDHITAGSHHHHHEYHIEIYTDCIHWTS